VIVCLHKTLINSFDSNGFVSQRLLVIFGFFTLWLPERSMDGQKLLRFLLKMSLFVFQRLNRFSKSYGFGMTQGWVNDDRIVIFMWTIPLRVKFPNSSPPCLTQTDKDSHSLPYTKPYHLHLFMIYSYLRTCRVPINKSQPKTHLVAQYSLSNSHTRSVLYRITISTHARSTLTLSQTVPIQLCGIHDPQ